MDKLIPVINKLQDVFNAVGSEGIDLPQLVVIGSQSSGKSSVLENIVGRDFLPRGSGIVTRRPLVLQLINLPWEGKPKESEIEEWGEFLHLPAKPFYDFAQIKAEIEAETDRITGTNKGVSNVPINLKIYSPHVLNLTLVDLPGMTRVAVGDQPKDIDIQIRQMALEFIRRPGAIILAVTPANIDLANSDALQLAKEVDPEGERTLGVITKIDLMDKGTDCMDVLTGQVFPLKLGFIGVVNRSQQDIVQNKPIREALNDEHKYFSTHSVYKKIAHRLGTQYLAQTMNKLLLNHIRERLPDLKVKISELLVDAEKEMQSYGDPLVDESKSKGAILLNILTKFSNDYKAAIDGKLTDATAKELYGGARINYIFNEIYVNCLLTMSPFDGLTINDIRTAIRNATGPHTALFVPEVSFELLTKRQIDRLLEPSLQCVDAVYEELQRIVAQLESKELIRFGTLREKVVEVVTELLGECRLPTREMIGNLISIELAFINTSHPDFVGAEGAINKIVDRVTEEKVAQRDKEWAAATAAHARAQQEAEAQAGKKGAPPSATPRQPAAAATVPPPARGASAHVSTGSVLSPNPHASNSSNTSQSTNWAGFYSGKNTKPKQPKKQTSLDSVPMTIKAEGTLSEREQVETELIKSLMESYFNIVRKNTQDTIPKSIMHFLVNDSKEKIHNRLVQRLYRDELLEELLGESPEIAARRKATKEMVQMLKRAHEILNEVRDFTIKT